jgi:hypothetical protein
LVREISKEHIWCMNRTAFLYKQTEIPPCVWHRCPMEVRRTLRMAGRPLIVYQMWHWMAGTSGWGLWEGGCQELSCSYLFGFADCSEHMLLF